MTKLTKTVQRISAGVVQEAGKIRPLVITFEPPSVLGFRAKWCRKTYKLTAEACYWLAIKAQRRYRGRQRRALERNILQK